MLRGVVSGFLLLSIFFGTAVLIPSVVYADITVSDTYTPSNTTVNDFSHIDYFEQQSLNTTFASDPNSVRNTGGSINMSAGAQSCITQLLGSMLGKALSGFIGKFTSSLGGLMGSKLVPIEEKGQVLSDSMAQRAKEVGGGVRPSLDGIAFCIGNMVVEGILQSTISWVKSGFEGSPAFVENPERFFTDMADYELGQMLDSLSKGVLCSPWDIEVRLGLLNRYRGSSTRRRGCTLSDVIDNDNIEGFIDGDFNSGGWEGWLELTQNSNNNPYGSYLNAISDFDSRVYARRNTAVLELNWNGGWRSEKDSDGNTTTPGQVLQSQVEGVLGIPANKLTFADEFDELINQLFNALLKNLFSGL